MLTIEFINANRNWLEKLKGYWWGGSYHNRKKRVRVWYNTKHSKKHGAIKILLHELGHYFVYIKEKKMFYGTWKEKLKLIFRVMFNDYFHEKDAHDYEKTASLTINEPIRIIFKK